MSTLKEQAINYLNAVFNEKDLVKVETFWKDDMIQHNPSMPNGLDVLRGFITSEDNQISYEPGIAMEYRCSAWSLFKLVWKNNDCSRLFPC